VGCASVTGPSNSEPGLARVAVDAGRADHRDRADTSLNIEQLARFGRGECQAIEQQVGPVAQRPGKGARLAPIGHYFLYSHGAQRVR
jgi:hypothetical protein